MYVNKSVISGTGIFVRSYRCLMREYSNSEAVVFVDDVGEFMRKFAMMDYETEQEFKSMLMSFMRSKGHSFEDEDMFLTEFVKAMPVKTWEL